MEAMEALRSTNQHGKMTPASSPSSVHTQPGQGLAALLVMVAVLCFIVAYCCWGAPCCRAFCRRRCCCPSSGSDIEASPSDVGLSVDQGMVATPTIILLPYGRMLVVDGTVFAQLQAETSGLDLIELGENVVRAQQRQSAVPRSTLTLNSLADSTPSILEIDSETGSKDGYLSPLSGLPPPTYDSIFGGTVEDLPPTYEDILEQFQAEMDRRRREASPAAGEGHLDPLTAAISEPQPQPQPESRSPTPTQPQPEPQPQPQNQTQVAEDELHHTVTIEEYGPGEIRESRV